ncbi:MAG: cohesin domain-containing protein [Clostridium sp.]|nr:cohesin domain-containing protein [Clostridium sp.]MCM1547607.1 cohesin domain-containing protein [Ruminococcus sp.]
MSKIKKRIIAIAVICAMSVSMSACSDKKTSSKDESSDSIIKAEDIKTPTLTSEEAEQLKKLEFTIGKYVPDEDTVQDPVEQGGDTQQGDNNAQQGGDTQQGGDNNTQQGDNNNQQGGNNAQQGDNNNQQGDNNNQQGDNNNQQSGNNAQQGGDTQQGGNDTQQGDNDQSVITGTKELIQSIWMELSKGSDYVFDGEFIEATFKIKETTQNGTYPITIEWLDFSDYAANTIPVTGINGSVVVGGTATETQFTNDGSFEIKADSVSGNPGDEVTVVFRCQNNPGICASIFRFGYDSDALEYVSGSQGIDFINAIN